MTLSFFGLFATLIGLLILTHNLHVAALLAISVALFVTITWCVDQAAPRFCNKREREGTCTGWILIFIVFAGSCAS